MSYSSIGINYSDPNYEYDDSRLAYSQGFSDIIELIGRKLGEFINAKRRFWDKLDFQDNFLDIEGYKRSFRSALQLDENDMVVDETEQNVLEIQVTPQVKRGQHGRLISLQWTTNTPRLKLIDGRGLNLRGNFIMSSGSVINLIYDSSNLIWQECSRSNDINKPGAEG